MVITGFMGEGQLIEAGSKAVRREEGILIPSDLTAFQRGLDVAGLLGVEDVEFDGGIGVEVKVSEFIEEDVEGGGAAKVDLESSLKGSSISASTAANMDAQNGVRIFSVNDLDFGVCCEVEGFQLEGHFQSERVAFEVRDRHLENALGELSKFGVEASVT